MLVIRAEVSSDVKAIDELLRAAFPSGAEVRLVAALRGADKLKVSLVAEYEGRVVGHVAFSPVWLEPCNDRLSLLGLAPLAVQPEFQRRGIGARLVEQGLQECRDLSIDAVVVLGEPAYYGRFGFRRASANGISNDYGADDAFMVLELRPTALAEVHGTARYASEFALVGE